MAKLFPFGSKDQIRRIADKLVKNGAVFKGNYNSSAYDRTCWYALSEEVLSVYRYQETTECICENDEIDLAELPNQNGKSAEPIPDSKPDINTDSKPDIYCEVVAYLNEKAKTRYKATINKTQSLIRARVNEGFTLEDFKRVINTKCAEWGQEPKEGETDMRLYLRPETLFGTKFESYLNQSPPLCVHIPDKKTKPYDGIDENSSLEKLLGVDFGDG